MKMIIIQKTIPTNCRLKTAISNALASTDRHIPSYLAGLNKTRNFLKNINGLRLNGPQRAKTSLWGFANNKGPDQPAHTHSLISAFVVRLTESIISRHSTSEITMFLLVSVVE